ncbi:trimethylamine methyltransferase family protein [Ruegeria litorea]|jgi:trimethylamine--corrinoid protein Co-methyltransferase|uniref:Methyltransferase n=1 Tax=Falsiruegeria litorea TaxID=1280831 RepID=A0ABS5WZT7_9RHOB|nr:trimethylamine methyltransferase family protein [Falsiruegeria litorea]MBT3143335.1 trimethylamine methyltransferase family protein [Falsiruegeria litorea]
MEQETRRRGRAGGRGARQAADSKSATRSLAYRQLRHPYEPQSIFGADEINSIHKTALRVLEELGMKILLPEAREIFAKAGAKVVDEMVFIGSDIIDEALKTAPASFKLHAANPEREQIYETGALLFMAGAGCPNATDNERGRRPGDLQAFEETLKLQQAFDAIHLLGPSVEPQDVPIHLRHYAMTRAQLAYTDKPMFIYARGRDQVFQSMEMIQTALELSDDDVAGQIWGWTNINSNSPRMLDNPMAQGIIDFARMGQLSVITPFCLAGAMAPITVSGALTLQHAEALAGIALAQMANPGAPVSYGGFSSNVDMKSGSPAFGTPEHVKMQVGAGQLARHVGLPWRSASGAASNTCDMQAATETDMAIWGGLMGNATLMIHAAGWLEGGLSFGYEKFINDLECIQSVAELAQPTSGSDAEIGFDALQEVDPGGHFFATAHTMARYQDAFYQPLVADLNNFGSWEEAGSLTSTDRATQVWKQTLSDFKAPAGCDERVARVEDLISKGTEAGGAAPLD